MLRGRASSRAAGRSSPRNRPGARARILSGRRRPLRIRRSSRPQTGTGPAHPESRQAACAGGQLPFVPPGRAMPRESGSERRAARGPRGSYTEPRAAIGPRGSYTGSDRTAGILHRTTGSDCRALRFALFTLCAFCALCALRFSRFALFALFALFFLSIQGGVACRLFFVFFVFFCYACCSFVITLYRANRQFDIRLLSILRRERNINYLLQFPIDIRKNYWSEPSLRAC